MSKSSNFDEAQIRADLDRAHERCVALEEDARATELKFVVIEECFEDLEGKLSDMTRRLRDATTFIEEQSAFLGAVAEQLKLRN